MIVAARRKLRERGEGRPAASSTKVPSEDEPWRDMVVSVAALNAEHDGVYHGADWSTHGHWVTCSCVGSGVVSTFVPGDEDSDFTRLRPIPDNQAPGSQAPDHYPFPGTVDSWAVWSGTSFAAPQVAGAISRLCRGEVPYPARGPGRAAEGRPRARRLREGAAPAPRHLIPASNSPGCVHPRQGRGSTSLCGRCRIRTCEGILRRIYSPLPLAARATCQCRTPGLAR